MTPVGATKMAAALAAAPMSAVPAKKCRDSSRSARPSMALASVPATKPNATLLDSAAACAPPIAYCDSLLQRRQHRGGGKPQRHAEHLADRKDGKA